MTFQSANKAHGSSNREAKGFLFLLFILLVPFLIQYTYRAIWYEQRHSALNITYLSDTCEGKKENEPFVYTYSTSYSYSNKAPRSTKSQVEIHVELNTSDSAKLVELPGIGPAYASRIIKYRNILGGYMKVEQLKEVYGMPEETFERIKSMCTVNVSKVKMIQADSLWLNPYKFYHPYLSKELKALINAKKKNEVYSKESFKTYILESNPKFDWYLLW